MRRDDQAGGEVARHERTARQVPPRVDRDRGCRVERETLGGERRAQRRERERRQRRTGRLGGPPGRERLARGGRRPGRHERRFGTPGPLSRRVWAGGRDRPIGQHRADVAHPAEGAPQGGAQRAVLRLLGGPGGQLTAVRDAEQRGDQPHHLRAVPEQVVVDQREPAVRDDEPDGPLGAAGRFGRGDAVRRRGQRKASSSRSPTATTSRVRVGTVGQVAPLLESRPHQPDAGVRSGGREPACRAGDGGRVGRPCSGPTMQHTVPACAQARSAGAIGSRRCSGGRGLSARDRARSFPAPDEPEHLEGLRVGDGPPLAVGAQHLRQPVEHARAGRSRSTSCTGASGR